MAKFINTSDYDATIHREILDSLLRKESTAYDPQIIEICEDRAIAEMKGYLNKTYDCEKIFSAEGEERKRPHPHVRHRHHRLSHLLPAQSLQAG